MNKHNLNIARKIAFSFKPQIKLCNIEIRNNSIRLFEIFNIFIGINLVYFCSYFIFNANISPMKIPSFLFEIKIFLQVALKPIQEDLLGLWIFSIFVLILLILERYFPADNFEKNSYVGGDFIYTLIEKLGITGLVLLSIVSPSMNSLQSYLESIGLPFLNLSHTLQELGLSLLPTALILLFIFDGFDTIRHRIEHQFSILWAFHSVHHSQTQMTFMTYDRNHIVSLLYNAFWYSIIARFLGVHVDEMFAVLIAFSFVEYLTHSNVRLSYGYFFDRVLASPIYHRMHHANAKEYSTPPYGCNFANIFPFWDIIMGTADFSGKYIKTGIYDETAQEAGNNYLSHQISGFKKFILALKKILIKST